MEIRLDDEEEFFSLENLSRHLLKHEETLNNKVLISSPKDNNIVLGETKTPFKKKFKHQNKTYPSSSKGFEKRDNGYNSSRNNGNNGKNKNNNNDNNNHFKQRDGKGKVNNPYPKEKFDGNCNYCGIQGHKEVDYYKKKREKKVKGNENIKKFKGKKNVHVGFAVMLYSMSHSFSSDWIVDYGCTNHLCFEKEKFENIHKLRKMRL